MQKFVNNFFYVAMATMLVVNFTACHDKEQDSPALPDYIAFDKNHGDNLGDQIDYAIFGKDGMGYLYDFQDENPNIPQRLLIYDNNKNSLNLVVNFDEEGLPKNILSEDFTVVLGNYEGNKFSAIIVTKDGERHTFENIETELSWNDYKNALSSATLKSSAQLRVSASDIWKFFSPSVNMVVGVIGCGLSVASGNIVFAAVSCGSAINTIGNTAGWWESPATVDNTYSIANYVQCAAVLVGDWSALWSCLQSGIDVAVLISETWDNDANWDRVVKGLTQDINNFLSKEYVDALENLGFVVNGGYNPPNIEGTYLATPLTLVKKSASTNIAAQWDMYVTFSQQNNSKLTVNVNYDQQSDNGPMASSGPGSFIVGEGKKFSVFVEAIRKELGYTAKTVEVFSGEMTDGGIKNYQWGVIMIDDKGNPLGHWIKNGEGYLKKDSDGFSPKISSGKQPSPPKSLQQKQQANKNTDVNAAM